MRPGIATPVEIELIRRPRALGDRSRRSVASRASGGFHGPIVCRSQRRAVGFGPRLPMTVAREYLASIRLLALCQTSPTSPHPLRQSVAAPRPRGDQGRRARTHLRRARRGRRPRCRLLRAKGVAPGDRVGIMLPTSRYFAVCYYGALRAGAVVVPMNPLLKEREVAFYLGDSGAARDPGLAPVRRRRARRRRAGRRRVRARRARRARAAARRAASRPARWPSGPRDDTAVILYTSGTTGKPKGARAHARQPAAQRRGHHRAVRTRRAGRSPWVRSRSSTPSARPARSTPPSRWAAR